MKRTLIFIAALALAPSAPAHEGHVHEAALEAAPRGGILRDAPPFKSELVMTGDTVRVYVYDEKLVPVSLEVPTATGDVQFPRQKSRPVKFRLRDGAYEARIPGISKVHRYDLHVILNVDGRKATADFGVDNIQ